MWFALPTCSVPESILYLCSKSGWASLLIIETRVSVLYTELCNIVKLSITSHYMHCKHLHRRESPWHSSFNYLFGSCSFGTYILNSLFSSGACLLPSTINYYLKDWFLHNISSDINNSRKHMQFSLQPRKLWHSRSDKHFTSVCNNLFRVSRIASSDLHNLFTRSPHFSQRAAWHGAISQFWNMVNMFMAVFFARKGHVLKIAFGYHRRSVEARSSTP